MTKLIPSVLRPLSRDGWLLFVTRFARLFAYGSLSLLAGFLFARPSLINAPFFRGGILKIIYDLLFYKQFVAVRPPEEAG
jgi:hypothetical protein